MLSTTVNYIGNKIENIKLGNVSEERVLPYFSVDQVRAFRSIFCFLNDKDRDILYLIFVSRKKQKDVQRILHRSQPSLCYDIKRIRRRLRYIFYLHSVFDIFVRFVEEKSKYFTPDEMEILTLMFYTSSFTMTSDMMGLSQVKTRYAYNKCLRRIEFLAQSFNTDGKKTEEDEMWEIREIFMCIRENLNSVRRVYKGDVCGLQELSIV
jgi:hypothetical protein